jgi:DHA2 family multidrug resistance protein
MVHEPEVLERERRERLARGIKVDWVGFVLVALALGCLEIVLSKGEREDWFASTFIVTFAAISLVSFLLFVPWELSRKEPIVDIRLYGHRQFATCSLMMLAIGAILFSSTQLLPQLVQTIYHYTATLSGLVMMAGGLAMLLIMPVVGKLSSYVAPKYLICVGLAIVALAMWHSAALAPAADFNFFAWARVYQTIGLPFLFIPITSASYAGLPPNKSAEASALINVARNEGGSIGISIAGAVLANSAQVHQNYLTAHLVPSSLAYQQALHGATAQLSTMLPQPEAQERAFALVEQAVQLQATLLAYIDVFAGLALIAAALVPIAFLLLRPARVVMAAH